MCRFLLVKSKEKIALEELLNQFSEMCEKSRAPDGDWQGDGWGIALRLRSGQAKINDKKWEVRKSLNPIWEAKNTFNQFPKTNMFVVHARSAGFPQHRGNIEYNQPYIANDLCFVFNGMIKGVKLAKPLTGKIGAQKIFSLILHEKKIKSIEKLLKSVDKLLLENSQKIIGMNIGIVRDDKFYVLCEYESNPTYFGVRYYQDNSLSLVCSEPIGDYGWKMMGKGEVIKI